MTITAEKVIISIFVAALALSSSARTASYQPFGPNSLEEFLKRVGKNHDCYFTIEEGWKDGETSGSLRAYKFDWPTPALPLKEVLDYLHKTVPNFTYIIDQQQPKIIHIVNTRLIQQKGYGMQMIVKQAAFDGRICDFVTSLSSDGIPILPGAD